MNKQTKDLLKMMTVAGVAVVLTAGISVLASSIGTSFSVDSALTVTGNSTLGANSSSTFTVNSVGTMANVTITNSTTTNATTTNVTSTGSALFTGNTTIGDAVSDVLTVTATTTHSAGFYVNTSGTSTIYATSQTAHRGGCIEMNDSEGNAYRIWIPNTITGGATTTGVALHVESGTCR
ncbi:MAG: hypothetical protein HY220_00355 [Candidatus Sungbacteria bacterium]|uniref:Uncharacterized protein n=1 Tax=Candidatus Sungiibacteriota bacterium TaxID=2750080 RepID=A0A9D6QRN8_9BACT|nr:hypothetical protein [Candidatus Sungbacteria bacterium]